MPKLTRDIILNIQERAKVLISAFSSIDDWEDRYREIIQRGKNMSSLDDKHKVEDNIVKGCQSRVWLVPSFEDGLVKFAADSDAAIVRGIVSILLEIYSGSTPDEILSFKPDFIDELGLRQHLSMSRANGLNSMVKKITIYAIAFKAKSQL